MEFPLSIRNPNLIDYRGKNYSDGYAYLNYDSIYSAINLLGRSIITNKYLEEMFKDSDYIDTKKTYEFSYFCYSYFCTKDGGLYRQFINELKLEKIRKKIFPQKKSRLKGLYVCDSLECAKLAEGKWDSNFMEKYLTKIKIPDYTTRLDSNWITYLMKRKDVNKWGKEYWSGIPYPGEKPIWEIIVDTHFVINDADLKYKALDTLNNKFKRNELLVLEDMRLRNELGKIDSNISYTGYFYNNNFVLSPMLPKIVKKGEIEKEGIDYFLPLNNTPRKLIITDKNAIITLPNLKEKMIFFKATKELKDLLYFLYEK